jgi:integrase
MLLYTGLRPSDIYNIEVKDIDMEANTFNYYSEKTDEYFQLPIHRELRPILYDRIKEVKEGKLFMYETIGNIGRAFRRYLKKLNLNNKGYTLRTFRKTVVSLMHDSGVDLATVSKLVGHKQITTTEKYYNKLSLQKKSDELNKLKFSNND